MTNVDRPHPSLLGKYVISGMDTRVEMLKSFVLRSCE